MTKKEQFLYLLNNMTKISHENSNLKDMNKSQRLCVSLNNRGFEIPIFENHEEIRRYFTEEEGTCELCGNKCLLKDRNISSGFRQFCSRECELKWRSNRQKENNTSNKIKDRKKWKEKLSKSLKNAIKDGKFTPSVTNSWCNSRIKLRIANKIVNVRSSWEAYFYLKNPTFRYEKTRILYKDHNGVERNYIVDFDDENGNLFEIKPSSKLGECSEKILAAKAYCKRNGKKFTIVDEKYFQNIDVSIFNGQPDDEKLKRLFSRYEN